MGVWFTLSTMSAAFLHLIAIVLVVQENSILLTASGGFLTVPGNSATVVLFCSDQCPTVIVCILLFTVCHTCIGVPTTVAAATIIML